MEPGLCVFRETCGAAMAIEHNGDIYSCDHYVYPENKLGNVMQNPLAGLVNSDQQRRFGQDKRDTLPRYCRECEVRFACNGECPKRRFLFTPDGEAGLNYLCQSYKLFFKHIDPYMRFMAMELRDRRAPANVMAWVRQREAAATRKRPPGRNDLLPLREREEIQELLRFFEVRMPIRERHDSSEPFFLIARLPLGGDRPPYGFRSDYFGKTKVVHGVSSPERKTAVTRS